MLFSASAPGTPNALSAGRRASGGSHRQKSLLDHWRFAALDLHSQGPIDRCRPAKGLWVFLSDYVYVGAAWAGFCHPCRPWASRRALWQTSQLDRRSQGSPKWQGRSGRRSVQLLLPRGHFRARTAPCCLAMSVCRSGSTFQLRHLNERWVSQRRSMAGVAVVNRFTPRCQRSNL